MLCERPRISRRASHDMILMLARHGDHPAQDMRGWTDADVKRFFELNKDRVGGDGNYTDFSDLVERCRQWDEPVPFVENFMHSTFHTITSGDSKVRVSRVDLVSGREDAVVEGPGILTLSAYHERFRSAWEARERAIQRTSQTDFHTAAALAVTSVQAYVDHQAERWNRDHPEQLLQDPKTVIGPDGTSRTMWVRFEEKIDVWLPAMTGGQRIDKGSKEWRNFLHILRIRDDFAVHPKTSAYGTTLADLARDIQCLSTGPAKVLIKLHLIFGDRIPSRIIRASFAPEVELASEARQDSP